MDFGYELPKWAFGVHCACAGAALGCLPFACYYGALIKHRLAFMTPVLCLALGYENLLLVLPSRYATLSAQRFGWVMNALIPPLFLTACFETGYVMHKHRSVKYLGINFDEGKRVPTQPCSWLLRNLVRLIALALLAMGLTVNFAGFFHDDSSNAGMSGFLGLAKQDKAHFYVSLVPALIFSTVSILIGATVAKYGIHSTLLIRRSLGWYYMLIGAVLQCAGQFPAQTEVYPATSMLGQTVFLLCIVLSHRIVLRDLLEAARITEFLRRQKAVQIQLAASSVLREGGLLNNKTQTRGASSGFPAQGQGGLTASSLPASLASTPLAGSHAAGAAAAASASAATSVLLSSSSAAGGGGGGGGGGEEGGYGWQRRPSSSSQSLPPHTHQRHHHHHHHHAHHQHPAPARQPSAPVGMQGISSSGGKGVGTGASSGVDPPPLPPLQPPSSSSHAVNGNGAVAVAVNVRDEPPSLQQQRQQQQQRGDEETGGLPTLSL